VDIDDWTVANVESVRFAHPKTWQAEVDRSEEGVSVFLQSDAVSFGVVGIYPASQEPDEIVEQILDSVRDEHPGIEVESLDFDAERYDDAVASEGLFMTLDMVAYCWVMSWRLPHQTIVVYVQCIQPEAGECEEIFHGICQSVSGDAA
jgi:hypothetical protein